MGKALKKGRVSADGHVLPHLPAAPAAGDDARCATKALGLQVRDPGFVRFLVTQMMIIFTKTGSGQTYGKHSKKTVLLQ
jgi:hypothetical protein